MNVFRPMCCNWNTFIEILLKHLATPPNNIKGALPPLPPTLSSGLLASVLPSVANLRLSRGNPLHPPSSIVKTHGYKLQHLQTIIFIIWKTALLIFLRNDFDECVFDQCVPLDTHCWKMSAWCLSGNNFFRK